MGGGGRHWHRKQNFKKRKKERKEERKLEDQSIVILTIERTVNTGMGWEWKERSESFTKTEAAAAKLLHSYPTLCNPIDSSPPGSPVPGILQARTLEWVAISFSNA